MCTSCSLYGLWQPVPDRASSEARSSIKCHWIINVTIPVSCFTQISLLHTSCILDCQVNTLVCYCRQESQEVKHNEGVHRSCSAYSEHNSLPRSKYPKYVFLLSSSAFIISQKFMLKLIQNKIVQMITRK